MSKWIDWLKGTRIVIWGASLGGEQAISCLRRNGLEPEAFCDNDVKKWGTIYHETGVISPVEFMNRISAQRGGTSEYSIIIASFAWEVIYKQIRELGIECSVYIYLLYDPCHLKNGHVYTDDEKKRAYDIYEKEDYTRNLLSLIIEKGYLNEDAFGRAEDFKSFGGIDAYFYDGIADKIKSKGNGLTLIDGGTFVGDSVLQMKEIFGKQITYTYGYEPNEDNCTEIDKKQFENFTLRRYGLSNRRGFLNFSESGCFFKVSENGEGVTVPVVAIDQEDIRVEDKCILKLDIEGSERSCLEGAIDFIRKYKPFMVVCLYHRQMDIIDIPEYIRSIETSYKFYLRGGMHTVLYCFPE